MRTSWSSLRLGEAHLVVVLLVGIAFYSHQFQSSQTILRDIAGAGGCLKQLATSVPADAEFLCPYRTSHSHKLRSDQAICSGFHTLELFAISGNAGVEILLFPPVSIPSTP